MRKISQQKRFLKFVHKSKTGCWLWKGTITKGYGKFCSMGKMMYAHVWSYKNYIGDIPYGLTLDHQCRVRNCVNPKHLKPMTLYENMMIGNSPTAKNKRKTHCFKGHPFNPENTIINKSKTGKIHRRCKTCVTTHNDPVRSFHWKHRPTHCGRGHEFTLENTYLKRNGMRDCKACRYIRYKKRYA